MNNDLISREALKEVITANHYLLSAKNNSTDYGMFTTGIMQAIDNAPTVDMNTELSVAYLKGRRQGQSEERPTGKWIIKPKENSQSAILICNKCKHFIPITIDNNFCPNCGADMRGGKQ